MELQVVIQNGENTGYGGEMFTASGIRPMAYGSGTGQEI
jgi:hypothetical protein